MSDAVSIVPPTTPPPVTLLQMMTGYWVSQAIYVAAKLGLADLMADGPVGCEGWPRRPTAMPRRSIACSGRSPASASSRK